ncbi:MAG: isocitrate lyase/phosphoenolpyruvate mutase family protein, partial [Acidimicrobiia bacterium]|nr:isocitrate lyase/phosphoenolpyruvate mutase family protein [Acidimicrobiia bacterium]
ARIESLILGKDVSDAVERAERYVAAGADGVMTHHKDQDPSKLYEFAEAFAALGTPVPLIAVPTAYSQVTEAELRDHGFQIVIYANQLLRAAYPSMQRTARSILEHERTFEIEQDLMSIREILTLIDGGS